ncbi:hypothetical protein SDC9_107775 [bioreactor metagenome]|uniref:Uncharacterized protein n=1 Tax=bioreactor metagenome TaxID=1076179 RepID=A0A645B8G7_9ZZZZ
MISIPFLSQSSRNIFPMSCFIFPYITCLRYFAANIMWYLHSYVVCAKVFLFIRTLLCYLMWLANPHYSNIGGFLYLLEAKALCLPRQSRGFVVTKKSTLKFKTLHRASVNGHETEKPIVGYRGITRAGVVFQTASVCF